MGLVTGDQLRNAANIARDRVDAEVVEITKQTELAREALDAAVESFGKGELLTAAEHVSKACSLEYEAFGHCNHSGTVAELVHAEHLGRKDVDFCGVAGCQICKLLTCGASS